MSASEAPSPTPAPPRLQGPRGGPLRALWHLLQPVLAVATLLALVGGAVGGLAVWLLRGEEGTAWLLARVPGMEVQGVQGALLSERFAVERVIVRWDRGQQSVTIEGLHGEGLRWNWHPAAGAWVGLDAQRLRARRVDVQTGLRGPRPITMPRTLLLPLRLQVERAEVAELQIDGLPPMRAVTGRGLRLWEPGGREYHADALAFDWERARIEGGVSFGANPPFTLQASARARALDGDAPWSAEASATGPLARFELRATLRGAPPRQGPAPAVDLEAAVTPLEAWALGALRLRTRALDLAALSARAPRTALSGRMDIEARSRNGPVSAVVELDNALPGRWDEGRVPVRQLQARLKSPDADRSRLLLEAFDLRFAHGSEDAGRWQGSGIWAGPQLQIDSRVEALRPKLLDGRAAVMTLSGPLAFTIGGLRSPDPTAPTAAPAPAPTLDLRTTLDGRIEGSPLPVVLGIDGRADAQQIELRELRAEAGTARAVLTAQARRSGSGPWQVRSSGQLSDFDPLPWWPGREGSAWRAGPHRLSGGWALDLTLPKTLAGVAPLTLLQGVVGSGTLRIERSRLAGVPVAATVTLGHQPAAGALASSIDGEVQLGSNRIAIIGRGDPLGDGRADQLRFELQAPELTELAPLARLLPELEAWAPRSGRAEAQLALEGRWPEIRSEGRASAQDVQAGSVTARQVQASWRFDTASDQPLLLQAEAQGLAHGQQRLEQLRADLRGTWRQHRLEATAALPLSPPATLALPLGLRTGSGTWAQLRADGQWNGDGSGGGRWSGRVDELVVAAWNGNGKAPLPSSPGSQWLRARDLRADVRFDAQQGLTELQAGAGQLRLADATTLRWDEVRVDLRGAAPSFALRAEVEPFALAPLLMRTQPEMGWQGDLRLAARVDLRVGEKVDADLVFERRDGDLRIADDTGGQPFGLNELRVVATAHDGVWQVAGAFAGKTLGEASMRLTLRPRPDQRWPGPETPIDGVVDAHVANLGIWGTWVPPGWRLSGEVRTRATLGGRVGAPDYSGEVIARDVAVRNLLLGVDVRQGEALLTLRGARAEIERFTLRGGDGTITVRGHAELAGQPRALLGVAADRFRALGRVDRQLITSGQLDLELSSELLRAEGRVRIDEGLFDLSRGDAPSLDDDVSIRNARPADADAPPQTPPPRARRNHRVAIELDLGERLKVRGRGLDSSLGGNLRLGSAQGRPTVHGIVSAAGGTYAAYGQKLEIERGLLIFGGNPENPTLDVLALRPNLDMQVGVAITGPLASPRVRLYAGSDMSESDKLSWLVLGRPSEGLGRADTALLQRAAVALLAGEGEAPTDALLRNLGLDQLSLRQSDTDVRETVISLGKQLSRRWYVGYERGVNATTGTWQLIYRIAQRFTLRAQSGLENSLDLIWVWRLERDPLTRDDVPKSPAAAPP